MKYVLKLKNIIPFFFIVYIACQSSPCLPPEKPETVPDQAEWFGGCDGGDWIQLVSDTNNYHFRVFRDWDGALKIDAIFVPESKIKLGKDDWKDKVYTYGLHPSNDTLLCIYCSDRDRRILLIAQYPPFGGEEWEILKEKYKLE